MISEMETHSTDKATEHRPTQSSRWLWLWFAVPTLAMIGCWTFLTVNVPYWDDYSALLQYLVKWPKRLFDFHNEHRIVFTRLVANAILYATTIGWLRKNTIDSLSGRSIDDNVADGAPVCHFEQSDRDDVEVWLLQKGGGSENMSRQYSLPDSVIGAGRDLDGVRKCLLDAVWRTQGFGCAPGVLGVCIGADRAEGFLQAKKQLLRPLDDVSDNPQLAELERRVLAEANSLGIGPMGMGGKTTLLGVKVTSRTRLPASFFVTVAYLCWACRRRGIVVDANGEPQDLN